MIKGLIPYIKNVNMHASCSKDFMHNSMNKVTTRKRDICNKDFALKFRFVAK